MKTANYTERQVFIKYDTGHHLLFLNEQVARWTPPQHGNNAEPMELSGWSYTGDMPDGSTIVEVQDVHEENRRDKYIAGLICTKYTIDAQLATLANGSDTEHHAQELRDFETFRTKCKQDVDELLSR